MGILMLQHTTLISDLQFQLWFFSLHFCNKMWCFRVLVHVYLTRLRKNNNILAYTHICLIWSSECFMKYWFLNLSLHNFNHQWAAVHVISVCVISSGAIFTICYEEKILKNWYYKWQFEKANYSWVFLIKERSKLRLLSFK